MKSIVAILTILICSFYSAAAQSAGALQEPEALVPITSTPSGGNWSSPSTWVGGAVPTPDDEAIIVPGATVTIDTDVSVGNITIGSTASRSSAKNSSLGAGAARLTFEETSPHAVKVWGWLIIRSDGIFSTGGGNVNTHVVTIGWHVVNNGVVDLSTNNGQAGATLKFDTFVDSLITGPGPVTDVYRIEVAKPFSSAQVTLDVSNF
jgi:hypothetical protein